MKKILIISISVIVLLSLAFLGYKYLSKPKTSIIVPTTSVPTPTPQDLKGELKQTEDDAGQADFKALDQDAVGL